VLTVEISYINTDGLTMLKNNISETTILKLRIEQGKFIHIYDNNALVMHYIFGYKYNNRSGSYRCGFPKEMLEAVTFRLEDLSISYEVFNDKNIIKKKDFLENNKYYDYYKESLKQLEIDNKITLLIQKLNCLDVKKEFDLLEQFIETVNKY